MRRTHLQEKPLSSSSQGHTKSQFAPRPFAPPVEVREAPSAESLERAARFGHSFADISILPRETVQPKLVLGPVGDKYEQEADEVARRVVETISYPVQDSVQRQEDEDEDELDLEEEELRRKVDVSSAVGGADVGPEFESAIQRARSIGQPLSDGVRQPMERAFGADFGRVRVHTDGQADSLNRSIQARAFTTGRDIFLRQGAYEPVSRVGQELIAHELVHVMQQKGLFRNKRKKKADKDVIQMERKDCDALPYKIIQRAIILGDPRDGSYYNSFSSIEAWNYLKNKYTPRIHDYDKYIVLPILEKWDDPNQRNFDNWDECMIEIENNAKLNNNEMEMIDQDAFEKALASTEHLRPEYIEVDWQYQGNIAQATTRFVKTKDKKWEVMIDVNEEEDVEDFSQINPQRRIGQRITMFIHEMAYHANRDAFARIVEKKDDPDVDHRSMFAKSTRDKYLSGFLHGLLQKRLTTESKRGLVEAWYEDFKFHVDMYGQSVEEKEEAIEWMEEARMELMQGVSSATGRKVKRKRHRRQN